MTKVSKKEYIDLNFEALDFEMDKEDVKKLAQLPFDDLRYFKLDGKTYYYGDDNGAMGDIPELTLLSGFDPLIVSYMPDGRLVLPPEYKGKVILKSGICLPAIAVNGQVAGIWNIKKNEPVIEFFISQPRRIESAALERVESIIWQTRGSL